MNSGTEYTMGCTLFDVHDSMAPPRPLPMTAIFNTSGRFSLEETDTLAKLVAKEFPRHYHRENPENNCTFDYLYRLQEDGCSVQLYPRPGDR